MQRPKRYGAPDPEKLSSEPLEMPLGYMRPTPLQDLIAQMVRHAVETEQKETFESEEEANDFNEENEDLLDMSAYTLTSVQEEEPIPEKATESDPKPTEKNDAPQPKPTGDTTDQNSSEPDQP